MGKFRTPNYFIFTISDAQRNSIQKHESSKKSDNIPDTISHPLKMAVFKTLNSLNFILRKLLYAQSHMLID